MNLLAYILLALGCVIGVQYGSKHPILLNKWDHIGVFLLMVGAVVAVVDTILTIMDWMP